MIWEIESRIGKPDRSTKFPFYQTRSELVGAIENGNLKAAPEISRVIIDDIKPYKGGNDLLYRLHDLDITDKHKLMIPIVSIVELRCASGEDDCGGRFKDLQLLHYTKGEESTPYRAPKILRSQITDSLLSKYVSIRERFSRISLLAQLSINSGNWSVVS